MALLWQCSSPASQRRASSTRGSVRVASTAGSSRADMVQGSLVVSQLATFWLMPQVAIHEPFGPDRQTRSPC